MKNKILAVIAGFFVQLIGLYVIHSIWLAQDYIATASLWLPMETRYVRGWATLLGTLIYAIGVVWIYTRGVESKPWVGQGVRFGFMLALITIVYDSSAAWNMMPVPGSLILKWIIGEGLLCIVLSLVIAAICQPKSSAA
ncbi:MAG TPA: hypothetical protein VGS15_07110 [Candidatus Acidoferrales bacterium]|nr:hypothetical protein [Candidatus Acidoferrales bacterium]